jgi:hypothetical protein
MKLHRVRLSFAWYDLWVGAYWDRRERVLYVCPLPCLLLTIRADPGEWDYDEIDPDYGEGDTSTPEDDRFRRKIEEQDSTSDL